MTKDELKPLAKVYFDNNKALFEIFGTEDRHFFYEEIQAIRYCGKDKIFFHFAPVDFGKKKKQSFGPTKKEVEPKVESKVDLNKGLKDKPKSKKEG